MASSLSKFLKRHSPKTQFNRASEFSREMTEVLFEISGAEWDQARPLATGSLAKNRLAPQSDLDLIFVGDLEAGQRAVRRLMEAGLKVRSKVLSSLDEIFEIDDPRDQVSFLSAQFIETGSSRAAAYSLNTPSVHEELELAKQRLIQKRGRRTFLKICRDLRVQRQKRYTALTGFLEPNLKFGSGGLRDIELLELVAQLANQKLSDEIRSAIDEIVHVRFQLGLTDQSGEVLSAAAQFDVFASDLKTEDERYAKVRTGMKRLLMAMDLIDRELSLQLLGSQTKPQVHSEQPEVLLVRCLSRDPAEASAVSARSGVKRAQVTSPIELYRDAVFDQAVTGFLAIKYYVSHDQYHQLTVGPHLVRALDLTLKASMKPNSLGRTIGKLARELSRLDWQILKWAALYHDVGKGSGRDHSDVSEEILSADWNRYSSEIKSVFKENADFVRSEILWLIRNHLTMSVAAFRRNAQSELTWQSLHQDGVVGDRVLRLAVFTAIDILATNPTAFTAWKEDLLCRLAQRLLAPDLKSLSDFRGLLANLQLKPEVAYQFDPAIVNGVSAKALAQDLKLCLRVDQRSNGSHGSVPQVFVKVVTRSRPNRLFVRFVCAADKPGLLYRFLKVTESVGLSIRHASIQTLNFDNDKRVLVYDWFEVKPRSEFNSADRSRLQRRMETLANQTDPSEPSAIVGRSRASLVSVSLVEQNAKEWVFSFNGSDEKGLLARIVGELHRLRCSIRWARVHTWGKQVDDVVAIEPHATESIDFLLKALNQSPL